MTIGKGWDLFRDENDLPLGTPFEMQSIGSPMYCLDVTRRLAVNKTRTVAL